MQEQNKVNNIDIYRRKILLLSLTGAGLFGIGALAGRLSTDSEFSIDFQFGINPNLSNHLPSLDRFPLQLVDHVFYIFNIVGQSCFPKIRQSEQYLAYENAIFKAVLNEGFFFLANDYVIRFQEFYDDYRILKPKDENGRDICLADSMRSYPEAWSDVVILMLTHSQVPLRSYLSVESY